MARELSEYIILKPSNIMQTFYILQPMVMERMRFSIPTRYFYFGFFYLSRSTGLTYVKSAPAKWFSYERRSSTWSSRWGVDGSRHATTNRGSQLR